MAREHFHWDDPLLLDMQLTDEEKMIRDAARDYAQGQLEPRVLEAFRHEHTDPGIFKEMGGVGLLGATISEAYGGGGLNYVSYGLIAREVERIDSGFRSMMSVQSSLVMLPIFQFGTEAQKQKYLPPLARGESIGCFGLTEPDHGSDPGSMITRAPREASTFVSAPRYRIGKSATSPMYSWFGRKPTTILSAASFSRKAGKV
jgi:glutaryl-CoA dehydrogenase